ncbi:hypothetical protein DC20_12125 [Rufibacter tibetensis]|uniref:DNA repair ATPase n=2 Tax=Rufibacter tibetensis TaxID=512763 RepID=A0A0N7HWL5_9BACT|nr:hypothetical protein DC20_12125 [Rufibacter tibetensis]
MFWGMAPSAQAQGAKVEEAELVVNGVSRKGQRITFQLDSKVVEKSWKSYLKEKSGSSVNGTSFWPFAKATTSKGIYTVEEGKIDTISNAPLHIVSKVDGTADGAVLFWALDLNSKPLSQQETPKEWDRSAGLLQQFARNLYLEDIQMQVEDAEDVVIYSKEEAKQMARLASKIQAKIAKRQEEKAQLEAALAAKTKELEGMDNKLQSNLSRQEALLNAKERELAEMDKRLQKSLLRQEVALREIEIMSSTMEAVKSKIGRMN